MKSRKAPYIFLAVLLLIIIFILGVNYGKNVEKTNKVISYVMSITPTKKPTPTVPISFKTYKSEKCGLEFLYPDTLTAVQAASDSAVFKTTSKTALLSFSCPTGQKAAISASPSASTEKVATSEVTFKNQSLKAIQTNEGTLVLLSFQLHNPKNGKNIQITVEKNLYSLFENTLQYTP